MEPKSKKQLLDKLFCIGERLLELHQNQLATRANGKKTGRKPKKVDPLCVRKLRRAERTFWKALEDRKDDRVRQYFCGRDIRNQTYALRAIAWAAYSQFYFTSKSMWKAHATEQSCLARLCCLQDKGPKLLEAIGVIAGLELAGAIAWEKDFTLTDDLLSRLTGHQKVLSVSEAMGRDAWLWQLARYDASECWQVNVEFLQETVLRRYQEFKRLVCTGEMTMHELEVAIARRNNPDLAAQGEELIFSEQEPSREGYRRAKVVADEDPLVRGQHDAATKVD